MLFDGAIFNAPELKASLALDEDTTNSQLILTAYQKWGDGFVNKLLGIWA